MMPPIGDQTNSQANNLGSTDSGLNAGQDWTSKMNPEQMFQLIDSIMPVEICLYHQVLPLSIEGSRLNLGMVNPGDNAALDYIRRIVAYVNYTLAPRHIPSTVHQSMLSAYLSYVGKENSFGSEPSARPAQVQRSPKAKPSSGTTRSQPVKSEPSPIAPEAPVKAPESEHAAPNPPAQVVPQLDAAVVDNPTDKPDLRVTYPQGVTDPGVRSALASDRSDNDSDSDYWFDPGSRETLIVDLPEVLRGQSLDLVNVDDVAKPVSTPLSHRIPSAPRFPAPNLLAQSPPRKTPSEEVAALSSSVPGLEPPQNHYRPGLAELKIQAKNLAQPLEALRDLAAYDLLQELLARVLSGGIGRLFFERQADQARILWSQNGEVQAAIEHLDFAKFQGVIDELKIMANLPMLPVQKSRQIEIERIYQGARLLLRFRMMPGTYGEEATLQVLRGAALKFHQQQHISGLEQDAIVLARQLQRKLDEIYSRAEVEPSFFEIRQESLITLKQVTQIINEQITRLSQFGPRQSDSK